MSSDKKTLRKELSTYYSEYHAHREKCVVEFYKDLQSEVLTKLREVAKQGFFDYKIDIRSLFARTDYPIDCYGHGDIVIGDLTNLGLKFNSQMGDDEPFTLPLFNELETLYCKLIEFLKSEGLTITDVSHCVFRVSWQSIV